MPVACTQPTLTPCAAAPQPWLQSLRCSMGQRSGHRQLWCQDLTALQPGQREPLSLASEEHNKTNRQKLCSARESLHGWGLTCCA